MVRANAKAIRVAFAFPEDVRWTGGVNYLFNLLFALDSVPSKKIEPILFAGNQVDGSMLQRFQPLARIERHPLFNRTSLTWKIRRIIAFLTGTDYLVRRLFNEYRVDVASHCNLAGKVLPFKTINWIPDFQHLHLPEFFSTSETLLRNLKFKKWLRESDLMVFSSEDALNDALQWRGAVGARMRVLHFVSQVNPRIYMLSDSQSLLEKYKLPQKFFYLPNQFWSHKNHRIVIEAVGILNRKGLGVHVVCTGHTEDLKSAGFYSQLRLRIRELEISDRIHVLGMIEYEEVLTLFRHCIAIINPSRFEGWSSSVEEAKSIGKAILLSDLKVHHEQNPPQSRYFDPDDTEKLADLLRVVWEERAPGPDYELENRAIALLPERTRKFGEEYYQIVTDLMDGGRAVS